MIAAVYARKSTEQNLADEEKSVTRQVEHARAYATGKGWTVADEDVYVDDGISGAEFVKRPGFLRLMNALKPRAPFQVLIMSEEARLGREAILERAVDKAAVRLTRRRQALADAPGPARARPRRRRGPDPAGPRRPADGH